MSTPATCHPERPRKLADGTCDRCYARRRYREDDALREATKAASRRHWHKTQRSLTEDQKEAKRAAQRRRYAANPRPFQSSAMKTSFGITLDDYDQMLASQGGVCLICSAPPTPTRRLAVDHCHTTGRIRGLLCSACNTGIGLLGDNPSRLQSAVDYLIQFMQTHPEFDDRPGQ